MDPDLLTEIGIRAVATDAARTYCQRYEQSRWIVDQLQRSGVYNRVRKVTNEEVSRIVPTMVSSSVGQYLNHRLPGMIQQQLPVYAGNWVVNQPEFAQVRTEHLDRMKQLSERKLEGAVAELDAVAKKTAERMARADTFGTIYKSIDQMATGRVDAAVTRMESGVTKRVDTEMSRLKETEQRLEKTTEQLNKYKVMSGIALACSLGSAALTAFAMTQRL